MIANFWRVIDERMLIRRLMTLGTFAMTMWVIWWAMEFASTSPRNGSDVAMIIGAIMVPVNALQGYLFGAYAKGREAETQRRRTPAMRDMDSRNGLPPTGRIIQHRQEIRARRADALQGT